MLHHQYFKHTIIANNQTNGMDSRFSPDHHQRYASQSSQEKSSHSQSHNRKLFIQRNSQQQQEIVIPYWDQESSNYHLIEEIRLLKKKNIHFESHMGRMKAEYEQLRMSLELMDENQKEHLRRFSQLTQRHNVAITKIQELKTELEFTRNQNADLKGDLRVKDLREEENRKRINKLKDQEGILYARILELESQIKLGTFRNVEEKRILQKSRQAQLQLLKLNLQDQQQKPVSAEIINELKASLDERDAKINKLQKQREQIAEQLGKMRKQHDKCGNKVLDYDLDQQQHGLEVEKLSKQIKELRRQIIEKKNQSTDRLNQIKKLELEKQERERQIKNESKQKHNKLRAANHFQLVVSPVQVFGQVVQANKLKELEHQLEIKELHLLQIEQKMKNSSAMWEEKGKQFQNQIHRLKQDLQSGTQIIQLKEQQNTKLRSQVQILGEKDKQGEKLDAEKERDMTKQKKQEECEQDNKPLSELQAEYKSELQALHRLILYKKYSANDSEAQTKIRKEYQDKFYLLVNDYQELQKQLLVLQEELLHQRQHKQQVEGHREIITFRTSQEERIIYLQAIRKWEIAYEQLHAVYEAKMVSKDEQINLLNLRLANRGDCYVP